MKKFFIALALLSAGLLTTQGLSAQRRVIKVQGHPHESLTKLIGDREDALRTAGSTYNINLADIQCWAGGLDPNIAEIDSAVLLIKFTDGKRPSEGDSIIAWGYRWNPVNSGGYAVTKYTIDMIRAVANADCRFLALLQNSSGGDFVAGGFGYNHVMDTRVPVQFDAAGAAENDTIKFHYTGSPNCDYGQGAIPYNVAAQATEAIRRAADPSGKATGIIRHPFDADYGYPAYDFDYWTLRTPLDNGRWQAGWNRGYWAFYHKEQLTGGFVADTLTITTRVLENHYVDGFVFENSTTAWPPLHDMSGNYTAYGCDCGCNAPAAKENVTGKRK
jgi:hypothetical protein